VGCVVDLVRCVTRVSEMRPGIGQGGVRHRLMGYSAEQGKVRVDEDALGEGGHGHKMMRQH
jgi:hypothetical protein